MIQLIVIGSCLMFGALVKRFKLLPKSAPFALNQFIIYVALPAVILRNLPHIEIDHDVLFPAILPWILISLSSGLILVLSKQYQWDTQTRACLLLTAGLGNTSYLGFPMVEVLLGNEALPYAIIYDQIGSFVPLAVLGTIVIAHASGDDTQPWAILKRIVTFPPFIALIVALPLHNLGVTQNLSGLLNVLGKLMMPVAMFLVGLQLSARVDRQDRTGLCWGLGIKMILMPMTALLFVFITYGLPGNQSSLELVAKVSVFEAAVPPMVTAGVMAAAAKLAPRLAVAMVGIGLLLAFVLLPLWSLILHAI